MTRPRPASERFAKGLDGAKVVIAPLMEIIGTGAEITLEGVAGLILTSEAVVPFLPPTALPAFCVGPRTAAAAHAVGLQAEVAGADAEGLIQTLADRRPDGRLLHLHGTHTRGDIVGRLCDLGLHATGLAVYDQRELAPGPAFHNALTRPDLIVPLFSPRSAKLFAHAAQGLRADTKIIALSLAVADALPHAMGAHAMIAPAPTGDAMGEMMASLGVKRNSP
ncbi:hypothetical protein A8B78_13015 [Jannaschia sp. EhC01]|nr:hypothetical protein A8B78_13015 [Jannaschia sp. EhC01]